MKQVCAALPLLAVLLGLPAFAQAADSKAKVAETPASFCAGKLDHISFVDTDGNAYAATREGDKIKIYREFTPESGDWKVSDNHLFSLKSKKLIQFSRAIGYAQYQNVYVQIVNAGSKPIDNAPSLPEHLDVPEIGAFQSLTEFCQLKVE